MVYQQKNIIFPEEISCTDFMLKKANINFAPQFLQLVQHNQNEFKFLSFIKTLTDIPTVQKMLLHMETKWRNQEHYCYFLFQKECLLGCVGIKIHPNHPVAELSYYLDKSYTGHGYISRALRALEKHFFTNGGHRTEIFCNETNQKSRAVAIRLGYHLDGIMREYELIDDQFSGVCIYSKLADE